MKFREPPNLLRLEVTEETTTRIAKTVRAWIKEAIRWLFLVGAEKEWPVFVGAVAGLLSLSYLGSCMDLLTLVYMGTYVVKLFYESFLSRSHYLFIFNFDV